jgi:hypothetical protein
MAQDKPSHSMESLSAVSRAIPAPALLANIEQDQYCEPGSLQKYVL